MGATIFSLEGKGLKLTTAEDIEPYIKELRDNEHVEEGRLLGNSLGVQASEALAKVLETKKKLQVCVLLSAFGDCLLTPRGIGCQSRRHLHGSIAQRNPARSLFASYFAARATEPPHCQSE
jgi:hypothetical protein